MIPEGFDGVVLACRHVDGDRLAELVPDVPVPPVYPGSIRGECQTCGVPVWIGPRTQAVIANLPPESYRVMCFIDAAHPLWTQASQHAGHDVAVANLGNPYRPKERRRDTS